MAKLKAAVSKTLGTSGISAVVRSYVEALERNETSGSLVTQVCDTANSFLQGASMQESEREAVADQIAIARKWEGKSLKSRKSEVNVVLKCYNKLPEAIKAYGAEAGKCQWHDGMKLARKLNDGKTVKEAVALCMEVGTKEFNGKGKVAAALKAWYTTKEEGKQPTDTEKKAIGEVLGILRITNAPWYK